MATTNHVVVPNYAPVDSSNIFNQFWKLTRALKKAGWKYVASGNGTAYDIAMDPALDKWGAGTISNVGAAAASIGAPARGRAIVTGLTGIVSTDKGKFLSIIGSGTPANNHYHQIEEVLSATSVAIDARNFAVVADAGPLTWDIRDPLGEAYLSGLSGSAAWWCARGPSIIKIPITVAPTPGGSGYTFIRGENIVQATSGFEGEIIGYVFDTVLSAGYLVVAPRLRGTGAGVQGITNGTPGPAFTGSTSGASVVINGTSQEFRHEIVIWKAANQTAGLIFVGFFDTVADATDAWSDPTKLATASASAPPSSYPNYAWTVWGSGTAVGNAQAWRGLNSANPIGNAQLMCADAIPEQNHSADGSWILAHAAITNGVGGGYNGFAFQRCDDSEEGDVHPYVTMATSGGLTALYGNLRTSAGSQTSSGVGVCFDTYWNSYTYGTGHVIWRGWRKRGLAGDSSGSQDLEMACIQARQSNNTGSPQYGVALSINYADAERVSTAPVNHPAKVREPIWIMSTQQNRKCRKGTLRWMFLVPGGNGNDTYESKAWVQLSPSAVPMVGGPWDGVSTPSSS